MDQKKGVSQHHNSTTHRTNSPPRQQVWYCENCGIGPLNLKLDRCCADCGQPRSSFCGREWVRGSRLDIPPTHDREPHFEALPIHAPHNYTSGAATPLDNAESAISKTGLTKSPLLPPYLPHQTHGISAGTDTAISASTQSETYAQQSHELASEQWAADRGGSDLIPVPTHEPLHYASSYNDTSCALPNGSPHYPASLYQFIAQSDSGHSGSGVDYSIHHSSEITGSAVGVLQNTRSRAEPTTRAKRRHVAVDDIASDASAPNSADGSAQACAIPALPGGIPSNIMPPGWPNSLHDVSILFPVDLQIPSPSFRLSPLGWISDDDCDHTTLSQPRLRLIDCGPFEPPPSSNSKSLNAPQSSPANGTTTGAPKKYECCKSSSKQRLACPFYKYEPQLHPNCMFKSFKTIGHMGQHLKQNHKLKANHCKLCWRSFETADLLTNHTQYCVQTGGISVDGMGKFPRMRWPVEKKWYWCWEKLFGKGAMQPECPFSHPIDDLQSHLLAQYKDPPKLEYIAGEWAGENDASMDYMNYTGRPSLSTSPD